MTKITTKIMLVGLKYN
ncbi:hypothetical protein EYZ11_013152 [Aspergillus tanneri]|uniref:Uncharacterized protein n=1 Tax=Aspergillus tanneri TaxID=1220188 RepID=A0A4S3IYW5_9EURO|nr:hypothetical protein EYZ11_013152 [Aspergillus tanneri]